MFKHRINFESKALQNRKNLNSFVYKFSKNLKAKKDSNENKINVDGSKHSSINLKQILDSTWLYMKEAISSDKKNPALRNKQIQFKNTIQAAVPPSINVKHLSDEIDFFKKIKDYTFFSKTNY